MRKSAPIAGMLLDLDDTPTELASAACLFPISSTALRHGAQRGARNLEASRRTCDPEPTTLPPAWDLTMDDLDLGPTDTRSGPVGQWRPTTTTVIDEQRQINAAVLASLQALTQQLALSEETRQPPVPDFTFSGADVEDPEAFVVRLERYFRERRVHEDNRVSIARKTLRGDARRWAESVSVHDIPWTIFVAQFVTKYSAPGNVGQLMRQLYGVTQGPREDAVAFVTKKFQLFQRVAPLTTELRSSHHPGAAIAMVPASRAPGRVPERGAIDGGGPESRYGPTRTTKCTSPRGSAVLPRRTTRASCRIGPTSEEHGARTKPKPTEFQHTEHGAGFTEPLSPLWRQPLQQQVPHSPKFGKRSLDHAAGTRSCAPKPSTSNEHTDAVTEGTHHLGTLEEIPKTTPGAPYLGVGYRGRTVRVVDTGSTGIIRET